jgi:phage repressor protein C with HTH and peptisase S24 domain
MVSISDRLREERERLGMSQAELADMADQSRKSQIRYESGERSPDGLYLSKIASIGVDILYVLTGTRSSPLLQQIETVKDRYGAAMDLGNKVAALSDAALKAQAVAAPDDAFAHIPLHDAFLAAGGGAENGAEAVIDYLAFRRDWLRRIGVAPSNAALARVEGDSMQPSIWHGDMVMIDHSVARQTIPVRARSSESRVRSPVYALLEDGKARVKRIERPLEDQLILISDNPDYAPQIVHPRDVTVIGKVIWWGHTAKE